MPLQHRWHPRTMSSSRRRTPCSRHQAASCAVSACRELYQRGMTAAGPRALWRAAAAARLGRREDIRADMASPRWRAALCDLHGPPGVGGLAALAAGRHTAPGLAAFPAARRWRAPWWRCPGCPSSYAPKISGERPDHRRRQSRELISTGSCSWPVLPTGATLWPSAS